MIVELRRWYKAPIIVLSGRTSPGDKIGALDVGADDYVTKPFAMAELLARLRAALRRDEGEPSSGEPRLARIGPWLVNLTAHQVTRAAPGDEAPAGPDAGGAGMTLRLTPTEWRIMEILPAGRASSSGRRRSSPGSGARASASAPTISASTWPGCARKLEDNPSRPRHLLTEPGMGYRYQP